MKGQNTKRFITAFVAGTVGLLLYRYVLGGLIFGDAFYADPKV